MFHRSFLLLRLRCLVGVMLLSLDLIGGGLGGGLAKVRALGFDDRGK